MKNTSLILSVVALVLATVAALFTVFSGSKTKAGSEVTESAAAAEKGAIVYFNIDKVIADYDMANDLSSVVESKAQSINEEVNRRGNSLQKDINDFQDKINKGLLTRSTAEVQSQKLEQRRNDFNTYANQKNQEIAEEQQVMMNQIGDVIKKFLDKYAADNGYAMVIATSGDILPSPVAVADSSLDVTEDIIAKINDEYVKNKSKNAGKTEE